MNRNSSNRTRQIRRGREPNGIPVGDKNESSRKAVILIHAQQGNRFTYAGRTTRGDLRGEVVRPELTASVTRSAESGSGFRGEVRKKVKKGRRERIDDSTVTAERSIEV